MVATYSTSNTVTEILPNPGLKDIVIETPATFYGADLVTIALSTQGISQTGILSISGYALSSTTGQIVSDEPTTAVTNGFLTITSASTYAKMKRIFRILGLSN